MRDIVQVFLPISPSNSNYLINTSFPEPPVFNAAYDDESSGWNQQRRSSSRALSNRVQSSPTALWASCHDCCARGHATTFAHSAVRCVSLLLSAVQASPRVAKCSSELQLDT